jgi:hypothetical protein
VWLPRAGKREAVVMIANAAAQRSAAQRSAARTHLERRLVVPLRHGVVAPRLPTEQEAFAIACAPLQLQRYSR